MQYGKHDYYFNRVMAVCIQLFFEYRDLQEHWLKYLSGLALVANFYLSTALKGNYIIDNYGGIVIGYYLWIVSNNWLSYYIDVRMFGMTIHERFPNIST